MNRILGIHGAMFGLMDGIVTVIGIILGISALGDQRLLILAAIAGALADSMANAAGIHVGTETSKRFPKKSVMISTIYAFASTFIAAALLIIPHFLLGLQQAILASLVIAIIMLGAMGVFVAHYRNRNPVLIALEYIAIGLFVSFVTYISGMLFVSIVV